ncbi:MAG: hypothetical protein OEZ06_17380 [Myxococcales bacterium]|nr:hypothetical protein [Myxococcales bacterium]
MRGLGTLVAGLFLVIVIGCGSGEGDSGLTLGGTPAAVPGSMTSTDANADIAPAGSTGAAGAMSMSMALTADGMQTPATGEMSDGTDGNTGGTGGTGDTSSGGGTPSPAGAPCTGKPGAPGTNSHSVMNGALNRTYIVHIPESLDPNAAAPVLFVHHGFTMSGQVMVDLTGFKGIADREGFIAVFPDGAGATPWNVGTGVCGVGGAVAGVEDDFGFVDKMLDAIEADHCVDRERVMTTGFSMGGYFSNHIGCQEGGSKIRAIAPHSGGTYSGDCSGAPLPVMLLHGTGDALITPDCGTGARDLWVQRNGCSSEFETRPVMGGHCEWHNGCPEGGQVVMCLFDGMAHAWAGAPQGLYGSGPAFDDASELIWDFFKQNL